MKQEENGQVELVQIQGSEMAEQETGEQDEGQMAENNDENSGQVVAQLIEAGEPAPGGKFHFPVFIYNSKTENNTDCD